MPASSPLQGRRRNETGAFVSTTGTDDATLLILIGGVVLLALALWAFTRLVLRGGEDLRVHDQPGHPVHGVPGNPGEGHEAAIKRLRELMQVPPKGLSRREQLLELRQKMDGLADQADLTGVRIVAADIDGVPGEWVLSEGCDPGRRLLYLHGGAFTMGSPRSHRSITAALSRLARAAVLAVDYRLMPEHRRLDGLADCQTAYRWILVNGPDGPAPLHTLFVAGDSAGGNLCLSIIAWARDSALRQADAAIALSPATDATLGSPSLARNLRSDHMLGPMFGKLLKIPRSLLLWFAWLRDGVRPCDPRVSPLHGDLSRLPPTLLHASEAEMLLDDSCRYVNKARAAGSDARLEAWHDMLHVWHAFGATVPQAAEAFARIGDFIEEVSPSRTSSRP
jgi:epsilon-lactone hydrolase